MHYAIGNFDTLAAIAKQVDSQLGFPKFAVDAHSSEALLPSDGQDATEVPGVSLSWAAVIARHDDASQGAYQYDEATGPALAAAGFTPEELPDDWFGAMPFAAQAIADRTEQTLPASDAEAYVPPYAAQE